MAASAGGSLDPGMAASGDGWIQVWLARGKLDPGMAASGRAQAPGQGPGQGPGPRAQKNL